MARVAPGQYEVFSFEELAADIEDANITPGNDVITLRSDVIFPFALPTVNSNITFVGLPGINDSTNRIELDGGGLSRLFFVSQGEVSFSNLTLQNSRNKGPDDLPEFNFFGGGAANGSALNISGGNVSVNDVSFIGNVAQGGSITVPVGGAGAALGGAVYIGNGSFTVTESRFINNQAIGGKAVADPPGSLANGRALGGAIYANTGAVVTIVNQESVVFQNNLIISDRAGEGTRQNDIFPGAIFVGGDTTAPTATFSPGDNTTDVDPASNLVLNFSEAVQKGAGNVVIRNVVNNTVVETIAVVSNLVTLSADGRTATINPSNNLTAETEYYITVDNGAFQDTATTPNRYVGISDATTWNFKTRDTTAPTATFSPSDDATGVDPTSNLILNFSEPVQKGAGAILIRNAATNAAVERIEVTSDLVSLSSDGRTATINPIFDLAPDTAYTINIASGTFRDQATPANDYTGINDATTWNFATRDTTPPEPTFSPNDNAVSVNPSSNLVLTFNEAVQKGTGNIVIHDEADNSIVETIAVTSDLVSLGADGKTVTINPNQDLGFGKDYYITMDQGTFRDTATIPNAYAGIRDATTWNFETARKPILILPGLVGSFIPESGSLSDWHLNRGLDPSKLVLDPILDVYADLVQTLKNGGYKEGEDFFTVPYDWRLPLAPTDSSPNGNLSGLSASSLVDANFEYGVDYLGVALKNAAANWQTRFPNQPPLDSVDIIAHSMGGLVARSYIQSAAYGDTVGGVPLPKVDNLIMLGTPNAGSPQTWNSVNDDWNADDFFTRNVLTTLVNAPYQKILERPVIDVQPGITLGQLEYVTGEPRTITGGGTTISKETIQEGGLPSKKAFIQQYAPSLYSLLPTYDFGVTIPADQKNTLLLDLNFDTGVGLSRSKVTNFYGTEESTITSVQERSQPKLVMGTDERSLASFTDWFSSAPNPGQIWWEEFSTNDGDGTVPAVSALSSIIPTQLRAFPGVKHLDLPSNFAVQTEILKVLGIKASESTGISTNLKNLLLPNRYFLNDPVDGFLVDAQGRRLGYSQATGAVTEIPNSVWFGDNEGIGWVFGDIATPDTLQISGLNESYYVQVGGFQNGQEVGVEASGDFLARGVTQTLPITSAPPSVPVDVIAPTATFSPTDNSTSVDSTSNLVLNFSEVVQKEIGNIVIRNAVSNAIAETVAVTSNLVTLSSDGRTATINPANDLAFGTDYYITIDTGAFRDVAPTSNAYAGIGDATTWNFSTQAAPPPPPPIDTTAPTATFNPTDNATGVNPTSNFTLNFSEIVQKGSGNIAIRNASTNAVAEAIAVTSNLVTLSSDGRTATVNPASDLAFSTDYYITIDTGAFRDVASTPNAYAGISDSTTWNFSTQTAPPPPPPIDTTAPTATFSPTDNATSVDPTSNLTLNFSEVVQKGTGNIVIRNTITNGVAETIAVNSNLVILSSDGRTATINPASDLAFGTDYNITIDAGAFRDVAPTPNAYAGISDATTWNFATQAAPPPPPPIDTTAPTANFNPTDNATGVNPTSNLILNFNEIVQKGTGNIVIHNSLTNAVAETIAVSSNLVTLSSDGRTATINPTNDLAFGTGYYITIDTGTFRDIAATPNAYAGINDTTAWNFSTQAAPLPPPPIDTTAPTATFNPTDNATDVNPTSNLMLHFSEVVQKGSGNIIIYNALTNAVAETIAVTSNLVTLRPDGKTVTINPVQDLAFGTGYYITIDPTTFQDIATTPNAYGGINDPTTWNFSTQAVPTPPNPSNCEVWTCEQIRGGTIAMNKVIDNPFSGSASFKQRDCLVTNLGEASYSYGSIC